MANPITHIAFRYLKPRRGEGFLSVIAGFSLLGITLGVATLIVVMAVMNGFRAELMAQILGINGHVTVFAQDQGFDNWQESAKRMQALPQVVSATPLIEGQAMVTLSGFAQGAVVRGTNVDGLKAKPKFWQSISNADITEFDSGSGAIIGSKMAQKFGLRVGDKLPLVAPQIRNTAFGAMPRVKTFTVAGIFDIGMYEYDSNFIYIPLNLAAKFFQTPNQLPQAIEIMGKDPDDVVALGQEFATLSNQPVLVRDWQRMNSSFFQAIEVERTVMFLILTLIILVAAFNIIATLTMLVKDKAKDIAILRTLGMTKRQVMRLFMLAGSSIGGIGTLLGFGLGVLIAVNIEALRARLEASTGTRLFPDDVYFLSKLPVKIDWIEVVLVVIMALALSFLATLYPAWRAAKVHPAEGLRYV